MNQIDEGSLAAYIDRFLASKSRLLDQRFFRGKVSNVVKSSPTPAYQCQVIPVGSTTPLSLLCCTPSYVPAVGDDVECVWRDQNTGYVLWPVTGVTGAAGVGFANPMTTAGDMIAYLTSNPQRLPVGSNGNFLQVVAGLPAWGAAPGVTWPLAFSGDESFQPDGIANNVLTLHNNAGATSTLTITASSASTISAASLLNVNSTGQINLNSLNGVTSIAMQSGVINLSTAASSSISLATGVSGNAGTISTPQNIMSVYSANSIGSTLLGGSNGNLTIGGAALTATGVASGVDGVTVTQSASGSAPSLAATGSDTNIDLTIQGKGTGVINFGNATTGTTSPAAGGAGALPATPTGYVTWKINGTARQLAYY